MATNFYWWKKPERTTDHGQATVKPYHLRLLDECTLFVIYKAGRELKYYWYSQIDTVQILMTLQNVYIMYYGLGGVYGV